MRPKRTTVQNCILVQIWLIFLLFSSSSLLSPCLSASLSHTVFILGCDYKHTFYLEGSLSTASAGRKTQKTSEKVRFGFGSKQCVALANSFFQFFTSKPVYCCWEVLLHVWKKVASSLLRSSKCPYVMSLESFGTKAYTFRNEKNQQTELTRHL